MGKFTEFKVPLKSLTQGQHQYRYHLGHDFFTAMECTDVRGADLDVLLTVTLAGDLYNLHFDISGEITLVCDRCLDNLAWPVAETYDIAVKYGDAYNDTSDTLLEIPHGDPDLNVAYMLYDTVMLSIPIKHVHPQGTCNRAMAMRLKRHGADEAAQGLDLDDLDTGQDDNPTAATDPRWDALRGLMDGGDQA